MEQNHQKTTLQKFTADSLECTAGTCFHRQLPRQYAFAALIGTCVPNHFLQARRLQNKMKKRCPLFFAASAGLEKSRTLFPFASLVESIRIL